jgi:hypothetical protein
MSITYTTHLNLQKPDGSEKVSPTCFNANSDTLDADVYAVQATLAAATSSATAGTLALRDSSARLKVADPSATTDAANKEYVDAINTALTNTIINTANALKFPYEVDSATYSVSIAVTTASAQTISHSLGAIPSRVRLFFLCTGYAACVDVVYYNGSYCFSMVGPTSTYSSGGMWKPDSSTGYLLYYNATTGAMGTSALGEVNIELTGVTFSSSGVTLSFFNNGSNTFTLATTVKMEVYK